MKKTTIYKLLAVPACLTVQQARAADLNQLIPNLYGGDGITLAAGHAAHFTADAGSALNQLNEQLGTRIGVFPFNSSAPNFAFSYDPELGTFVSTSDTLGPIFAERAATVGKGKWSLNFYGTFFEYDTLNGQDLSDLHVTARHGDVAFGPGLQDFERDVVDIQLDTDASVRIFSAGATYGVTEKFDVSLLIPVVHVDVDVRSHFDVVPHPETAPGVHTVGPEAQDDRQSGSATGLGDILLGAKYRFHESDAISLAGAFIGRFATGDDDDFLGSGDNTLRPFLVASRSFRNLGDSPINLTPHLNVGYEFNINESDRSAFVYAAGFDVGTRKITLAWDLLGSHEMEEEDRLDTAVGVKWAAYKQLVLSGNVILPLNNEGLRSDVITTFGIGVSF